MRMTRTGIAAYSLILTLSCFSVFSIANTAIADTAVPDRDPLIETLVSNGVLSREEADRILADRAALSVPPAQRRFGDVLYEPTEPVRDDDPRIQVGRFTADSADGRHRFRFRGRLQFDMARADFGDGIATVANQSGGFSEYGTIFRRARLGALGYMYDNWEWQLEADFAELSDIELANAYIAYLTPRGRIVTGNFKEPFGLEYATSSRRITFLERAAASDAYKVDRQLGVMYETIRPDWYAAFGAFGGDAYSINRDVEEGWSLAGRFGYALHHSGTDFVHLGAAVNHRWNGIVNNGGARFPVRLRTREGTRVIDARLIGREDLMGVEQYTRAGLEFAAGFDSWSVQAEYIRVDLDIDPAVVPGTTSVTQDGWYVQGSWFLTGEQRVYRPASANFGRIVPANNFEWGKGTGALELALRFSHADSTDHTNPAFGQRMDHWTLGLNWYTNPNMVLKFNAIHLDAEGFGAEDTGMVYALRIQYEF